VWLFGIFVFLSVPLVAYHTLWKQPVKMMPQRTQPLEDAKNRPNVILVTFDALTARNMSVYGYKKGTTPFITEWAKHATVFTKVEAASNFTTSSTASLMTGKNVWTHQTYHIEGTKPVNSYIESLPSLLKNNGYYNMAFVVNPHSSVQILGMENSFDIAPPASDFSESTSLVGWQFGYLDVFLYRLWGNKIRMHDWILKDDFILKKVLRKISRDSFSTTVPPDKAFNAFLDVMYRSPQQPFFAWIHVFPPHDPYLPPAPYMVHFNPSSEFRSWKTQEQVKVDAYKYLFQYLRFPEEMQPAVDLMRDYYDEFILYSDKKFGEFIAKFNAMNIGNTMIILTADHGESFEHGYFTHGGPFLYEQVTHIPLIIKEPSQLSGQVVSDIIEQIDIPATILDFANIEIPSWMEGRSLVPLMRGEELLERPAFSMNFEENQSRGHKINKGSIAVWEGDYKLIHYLEKKDSLLFNLKDDPDELYTIIEKDPEKYHHLLSLIIDNLESVNKKMNH
jgi:arylsulfatase A-like enzyme